MNVEYEHWIRHDAIIEASKVRVHPASNVENDVEDEQQQQIRGLFATEDIFPGERILFIPARSLIGEQMISTRPLSSLQQQKHPQNCCLCCGDWQTAQEVEEAALDAIHDIKELILSTDDTSFVKSTAANLDYQWRGDDGVALYLMACKRIVGMTSLPNRQISEAAISIDSTNNNLSTTREIAVVDGIVMAVQPIVTDDDDMASSNPAADDYATSFDNNMTTSTTPLRPLSFLSHVAMLPNNFPTMPLYFTQNELSRLEGTNCHEFVIRMQQQMNTDWSKLAAILRAYFLVCGSIACHHNDNLVSQFLWDPDNDFELYKWALCNIYSRSTDFVTSSDIFDNDTIIQTRVIIPYFDMINHDFSSELYHAMDQEGNVSLFNGNNHIIPAGSEIRLNYGNFPNEKLLFVYGFVILGNPNDAVQIYAPLLSTDPLYEVKARLLYSKCGIDNVMAPHLLRQKRGSSTNSSTIIPHSLLSVLRMVGIQIEEELFQLVKQQQCHDGGNTTTKMDMISPDNEVAALSALGGALDIMAHRLLQNMEDHGLSLQKESFMATDISLQHFPLSTRTTSTIGDRNLVNITILCRSEYDILQQALIEISERLEKLQSIDSVSSID